MVNAVIFLRVQKLSPPNWDERAVVIGILVIQVHIRIVMDVRKLEHFALEK